MCFFFSFESPGSAVCTPPLGKTLNRGIVFKWPVGCFNVRIAIPLLNDLGFQITWLVRTAIWNGLVHLHGGCHLINYT